MIVCVFVLPKSIIVPKINSGAKKDCDNQAANSEAGVGSACACTLLNCCGSHACEVHTGSCSCQHYLSILSLPDNGP